MSKASERAYSQIRAMILSGSLPAGAQLGEEALAERCGVSRTPVRDALRRLEGELLVKRSGTQRTFVADWSLGDVGHAFYQRGMLESHAARRAAERMNEPLLQRLRAANRGIATAVRAPRPDVDGFIDHNREFHGTILEAAASPRLAALLGSLIEQPVVWRTAHQYGREALNRSFSEHDELIAACARRDGAWAEAVMAAHIRRAYHAYADAHSGLSAIDGRAERTAANG